jgi:hypothetical protein
VQVSCHKFSSLQFDNIILRNLKAKEANPSDLSLSMCYKYSPKMSMASLRPYIWKYHLELYLTLAKEKGWKILPGLISQTQSQVTNEAAAAQGEQPDDL